MSLFLVLIIWIQQRIFYIEYYSEFFITLKNIPLYNGEFTPIGKVIYGLDSLKKIKSAAKSEYVLRPDFINNFKLLEQNN